MEIRHEHALREVLQRMLPSSLSSGIEVGLNQLLLSGKYASGTRDCQHQPLILLNNDLRRTEWLSLRSGLMCDVYCHPLLVDISQAEAPTCDVENLNVMFQVDHISIIHEQFE
jgi:hypothetical protein